MGGGEYKPYCFEATGGEYTGARSGVRKGNSSFLLEADSAAGRGLRLLS